MNRIFLSAGTFFMLFAGQGLPAKEGEIGEVLVSPRVCRAKRKRRVWPSGLYYYWMIVVESAIVFREGDHSITVLGRSFGAVCRKFLLIRKEEELLAVKMQAWKGLLLRIERKIKNFLLNPLQV